jgi:hypothetical protein
MAENTVLFGYTKPWRENPAFIEAMILATAAADKKNFVPCRVANKGKDLGADDKKGKK